MSHETQKVTMSMDRFIRADPTYSLVAVCDGAKTQIFSFSQGQQKYEKDLPPPEGNTEKPTDLAFLPVSKEDAKFLEDEERMSGRMLLAAYGKALFLYEEDEPFDFQCRGKVENVEEFGSCLVVSSFPPNLMFGMITPDGICCVYSLSVGHKGIQALPIRKYTVVADEKEAGGEETTKVTKKLRWTDFLDKETILCASEDAVYECKLALGIKATEKTQKVGNAKWTHICLSRNGTGQLAMLLESGKLRVYQCSRQYQPLECDEKVEGVQGMEWSPFGYCLAVQKTDGELVYFSASPVKDRSRVGFVFKKRQQV